MRHRNALALLAVVALTATAVGCGGDDGESEMTSVQQGAATHQQGGGQTSSGNQGGQQDSGTQGQVDSGENSDLGRVVENPTNEQLGIVQGADNSLQTYGTAAQDEELAEIVHRMRSFFAALGNGVESACPFFSSEYLRALEQFATQQSDVADGCEALASLITTQKGVLAAEARKGRTATVVRVGIEDGRAIIMLRPNDGRISSFTMVREDGEWMATSLQVAPLPR